MRNHRIAPVLALAVAVAVSLGVIGVAAGKSPKLSATPVFKLHLKPSQEVPKIQGLRADGVGSLTFDVTRDSAGVITAAEAIFYVNYSFPGSVEIIGLHVHQAKKGVNGPVLINSGVTPFTDADGAGNVTTIVASVDPAVVQAILKTPRDYYVNLHTTANPGGAMREQLHGVRKR